MKVAPVSADLLIKAAGLLLLIGGAVYLVKKAGGAVSGAWGSVTDAAADTWDQIEAIDQSYTPQYVLDAGGIWELNKKVFNSVNPASDQNLIYGGVNAIGAWATDTPSGQWSLGSWWYDVVNGSDLPPRNTGGATGSW